MVSNYSEEMRNTRLSFYEDDIEKINEVLVRFMDQAQSKAVLLVDREGHMVTEAGFTKGYDTTSVAALVAGSFASTKALAEKVGESSFTMLFHEGANENLHVSLVDDRALLVIIFDDRTTMGMVRLFSEQMVKKVAVIFHESAEAHKNDTGPVVTEEFTGEAQDAIDDFFGSVEEA